jgi:hypothetical protein
MCFGVTLSKSAQSHKFQKSSALLMSCRQCNATILVQGVSCVRVTDISFFTVKM